MHLFPGLYGIQGRLQIFSHLITWLVPSTSQKRLLMDQLGYKEYNAQDLDAAIRSPADSARHDEDRNHSTWPSRVLPFGTSAPTWQWLRWNTQSLATLFIFPTLIILCHCCQTRQRGRQECDVHRSGVLQAKSKLRGRCNISACMKIGLQHTGLRRKYTKYTTHQVMVIQ